MMQTNKHFPKGSVISRYKSQSQAPPSLENESTKEEEAINLNTRSSSF